MAAKRQGKQTRKPKLHRAHLPITWTAMEKTAVAMALQGYATRFCASQTGMTENQVNYRVAKLHFQGCRRRFRNGETPLSLTISGLGMRHALAEVNERIRTLEPAPPVSPATHRKQTAETNRVLRTQQESSAHP